MERGDGTVIVVGTHIGVGTHTGVIPVIGTTMTHFGVIHIGVITTITITIFIRHMVIMPIDLPLIKKVSAVEKKECV
jgi:hypothetical protein